MSIEVVKVSKWFGKHQVLDDVSLKVESGSLVALLGPSGSGKTTLLRILAGLEAAEAGQVLFDGKDVARAGVRDRGVGFVFQHYALFKHMSVRENVAFGLRVLPRKQRPPEEKIRAQAEELLRLVHLDGFMDRHPAQLSGGQRQRVALARALAVEPKVLLLDEPFGALDAKVRKELRRWLRNLHEELHVTSILVTHDQDEALEVADRVVVMHEGKIHQAASPAELHDQPATPFVAEFLGDVNVLEGTVDSGLIQVGSLRIPTATRLPQTGKVRVAVRMGDVRLWIDEPGIATVTRVADVGDRLKVEASIDGAGGIIAHVPRFGIAASELTTGVRVAIDAARHRAYPL